MPAVALAGAAAFHGGIDLQQREVRRHVEEFDAALIFVQNSAFDLRMSRYRASWIPGKGRGGLSQGGALVLIHIS